MSSFMDERLPLVDRLSKLALLIGSEQGLPEHRTEAEALVREAIMTLMSLLRESSGRQSVLDALTNWNNALREENERLKLEIVDLEVALFDSSGRGMDA